MSSHVSIPNILLICHHYLNFCECFSSALTGGYHKHQSDRKFPQISSTHLNILANLNCVEF